jgi:hypothetical protein
MAPRGGNGLASHPAKPTQRKASARSTGQKRQLAAKSRESEDPPAENTHPPRKRTREGPRQVVKLEDPADPEEIGAFRDLGDENEKSDEVCCLICTIDKLIGASRTQDDCHAMIPDEKAIRKESSRDLLTVFSDRVEVKFTNADRSAEVLKGHWCMSCR